MAVFRKIALVLGFLGATASSAAAQGSSEWLFQTAFEIQSIGTRCLEGGQPQTVHILGVLDKDGILSPQESTTIATDLTGFLAGRLNVRVSKADNLGDIAGSYAGFSDEQSEELGNYVRATSQADVTILLAPVQRDGTAVQTEVRMWTRGDDALSCAPSFRVRIPVATVDPMCARSYEMARGAGTVERLEAFIEFFPDCPEVAEARATVSETRAAQLERQRLEGCRRDFQAAVTARKVSAFDTFIDTSLDCPEYQSALLMRETLRESETCVMAYRDAEQSNTEESYGAYLRDHLTCPQAGAAQIRLDALKDAAAASQTAQDTQNSGVQQLGSGDKAPPVSQPVIQQPVQRAPTCDELWYQRNAIYDAAGYCFQTARGQQVFNNAGCTGGTPSGSAMQEVQRIIRLEEQYGCR